MALKRDYIEASSVLTHGLAFMAGGAAGVVASSALALAALGSMAESVANTMRECDAALAAEDAAEEAACTPDVPGASAYVYQGNPDIDVIEVEL